MERLLRKASRAIDRFHFYAQKPFAALLADAPSPAPFITARAVYCMEKDSRAALFARNANFKLAPASIVKLATALVFLQGGTSLDDTVTIEPADCQRGSTMGLRAGDIVSYRDLLHGLLIASGNDAAHAIARTVAAGGRPTTHEPRPVDRFVQRMNELAVTLGLSRTRFVNPSGLVVPGQYSTARDLAVLGAVAFSNPMIVGASSRAVHVARIDGPEPRELQLSSTLAILGTPGVLGGKTGTAPGAGANLVMYSRSGGREVVTVLLSCAARFTSGRLVAGTDRRFDDARMMLAALDGLRLER